MSNKHKDLNEQQLIFRTVDRIVKNTSSDFDAENGVDLQTWALQLDISTRFLESLVKSLLDGDRVEEIQQAYEDVKDENKKRDPESNEMVLSPGGQMKAAQKRFEMVLESLHMQNKFFSQSDELVIQDDQSSEISNSSDLDEEVV